MIDEPPIDGDVAVITLDRRSSLAVDYAAARMDRNPDGELVALLAQRYIDRPARTRKDAVGAQELGAEEFDKFAHQCPKCGFEWDG